MRVGKGEGKGKSTHSRYYSSRASRTEGSSNPATTPAPEQSASRTPLHTRSVAFRKGLIEGDVRPRSCRSFMNVFARWDSMIAEWWNVRRGTACLRSTGDRRRNIVQDHRDCFLAIGSSREAGWRWVLYSPSERTSYRRKFS